MITYLVGVFIMDCARLFKNLEPRGKIKSGSAHVSSNKLNAGDTVEL